jgi:plastocyanin
LRKMVLVTVAVLGLVGAGCSSGGGDNAGTTGTPGTTATGSTGSTGSGSGCTEANAVDLSGDEPFTVTIENLAYDPSCFKASAASTITIENKDSVTHTFSIDGTQVDATINGLETFNGESPGLAPGSYDFYCKLHPTMTGTVIVV